MNIGLQTQGDYRVVNFRECIKANLFLLCCAGGLLVSKLVSVNSLQLTIDKNLGSKMLL